MPRRSIIPYEEIAAAEGDAVTHSLSERSQFLALSMTGYLHWSARWYHTDGSEFTDEELELIEDWASKAEDELLTPVEAGEAEFPTPFWDSGSDVDDSLSADEQYWYGVVENYTDSADELSFVENAAIWLFTGFLAYSGEIGAAIAFHSIAPRFVLAWRRGDVGEIWRIVVNSAEQAGMDTSSAVEGDILTQIIQPAASETGYDILLVQVG